MMGSRQLLAEFNLAFVDRQVDTLRQSAAQLASRGEYLEDVLRCVSPHAGEVAIAVAEGLAQTDNAICLPYLDHVLWAFEKYQSLQGGFDDVIRLLRESIAGLEAHENAASLLERRIAGMHIASRSKDDERVLSLARVIASEGPDAATRMWRSCVEPGDTFLTPCIVEATGDSGDERSIPLLEELIDQEQARGCPENVAAAGGALAKLAPKKGVARLLKLLEGRDREDAELLYQIAEQNDPAGLPRLKAWVERCGKRQPTRRPPGLLGWLLGCGPRAYEDVPLAPLVITQLEEGAQGLLREAKNEASPTVARTIALRLLMNLWDAGLGPEVEELIHAPDPDVAKQAIQVLIRMGYGGATDTVLGVLKPNASLGLRRSALDYLYCFGDAHCTDAVRALLADPDPLTAVPAAVVLEKLTSERHELPQFGPRDAAATGQWFLEHVRFLRHEYGRF